MVARDDDAFARATPSSPFGDTVHNIASIQPSRVRGAGDERWWSRRWERYLRERSGERARARRARWARRAIRANRAPAETTTARAETAFVFSSTRDAEDEESEDEESEDALTEADASTHLVVLRFGKYYGFRSQQVEKLLQAPEALRRAPCFYSFNFGVCEQWELVAIDHAPVPCGGRAMRFRNRRFERVELDVAVARVRSGACSRRRRTVCTTTTSRTSSTARRTTRRRRWYRPSVS